MNDPYHAPETPPVESVTRRQRWLAIIFGIVVIGSAFGYQSYRFNQVRHAAEAAKMRAMQAQKQAEEALKQMEAARMRAEQPGSAD